MYFPRQAGILVLSSIAQSLFTSVTLKLPRHTHPSNRFTNSSPLYLLPFVQDAEMPKAEKSSSLQQSSRIPPLTYEIYLMILSHLSFEDLFYTRGVNRWFYQACIDQIYYRFLKESALHFLFRESVCPPWGIRCCKVSAGSLKLSSKRGDTLVKWSGKGVLHKHEMGSLSIMLGTGERVGYLDLVPQRITKTGNHSTREGTLNDDGVKVLREWFIGEDIIRYAVNEQRRHRYKEWREKDAVEGPGKMILSCHENGWEATIPLCRLAVSRWDSGQN